MPSLIERLDVAYKNNSNPDQIAAQITNQMSRWVLGKDITAETLEANLDQLVRIYRYGMLIGETWTLTWTIDSLNRGLGGYWFILDEHYNPNDPRPQ